MRWRHLDIITPYPLPRDTLSTQDGGDKGYIQDGTGRSRSASAYTWQAYLIGDSTGSVAIRACRHIEGMRWNHLLVGDIGASTHVSMTNAQTQEIADGNNARDLGSGTHCGFER